MTTARITGILLFLTGIALDYFLESDRFDIFYGLLMGIGIGLILTGRFRRPKVSN